MAISFVGKHQLIVMENSCIIQIQTLVSAAVFHIVAVVMPIHHLHAYYIESGQLLHILYFQFVYLLNVLVKTANADLKTAMYFHQLLQWLLL